MLPPDELLRTIYLGDRCCQGFSVDSWARRVLISIDCISRVRSPDGQWHFYTAEDIEKGILAFDGVSWFEISPPGAIPDDYVGHLVIEHVEDGVYSFCFDAGATQPQVQVMIRIKARELYLVDPRDPEKRIY